MLPQWMKKIGLHHEYVTYQHIINMVLFTIISATNNKLNSLGVVLISIGELANSKTCLQ